MPCASERGHHRADGHGRDRSNFLVGTALEFPEDEDFAKTRGKILEGARQPFAIVAGNGQRFGSNPCLGIKLFVKFPSDSGVTPVWG